MTKKRRLIPVYIYNNRITARNAAPISPRTSFEADFLYDEREGGL